MSKPIRQIPVPAFFQSFKFKYFVLLPLISLCFLSAEAAEIQTNQLYQGGTQVQSSDIGLGVTIPESWQGALPAGSSFFVIESAALQATILLYAEQMSKSQLQQTMSQSIPLDASIQLVPTSAPRAEGDLLIADYQVPARPELKARIIGRTGSNGLSVALITLTPSQDPAGVFNIAKDTAMKLNFFQPKQSATSTGGSGSWQEYMRGRYIARYYSGSSYHEKQEIWLCSNGEFHTSGDSGGYGGGASGAYGNRGTGRWRAEGSLPGQGVLVLQYGPGYQFEGSTGDSDWSESGPGGEQARYRLSLYNDKLYLDDTQWLRGTNEYCQ
ncbi:hypothetical protein BTA51_00925 [Hahella sp. CCB-MM4]|uniref:hypothetical protein n=1 Tax=Hahella sp. (strain CCB-MM4) TaxID=1926491 RepID=UPI000B9C3F0E|nr:hypothetical protein [Hahella sp. CCB-MM4]OZG74997.1 hypothetical protein BTA51_00925 [Hahella sp. CCB-MM4]